MRVSKFLSVTLFITSFCLLYVYQQTEIFRLAYTGQKKQALVNDLLDKNTVLRYNIRKDSSLVRIGSKISGSDDFQMPDSCRTVKFISSKEGLQYTSGSVQRETLLSKIFSIKRQAEARTP